MKVGKLNKQRARSLVGRALLWHSRGQGFESPRVHLSITGQLAQLVRAHDLHS